MERIWIRIQHRVHKPNAALSRRNPLLINPRQDCRERRRRRTRPADQHGDTGIVDDDVIAHRGHVRVATASTVVDAAVGAEGVVVRGAVVGVGRVGGGEVGGYGLGLVRGLREYVAEAAAGGEACYGYLFVGAGVAAGGKEGGARGGEVGAADGEVWDRG